MGLERLAPAPGDPGLRSEPEETPREPLAVTAAAGDVPFGVSAEAFLAARGITPEPLAAPQPRKKRAPRPTPPEVLDLVPADQDGSLPGFHGTAEEAATLPGRFQGPAASRQVGGKGSGGKGSGGKGPGGKGSGGRGSGGKGARSWPTREEREARQVQKAQDLAAEIAADPIGVARELCLRQLETGPRTRTELARALATRGVPDEAADEVLGRFAEVGIIDDALFASLWVSSRHRGRGLAGRALSQELRRKGVDDETVRAAVEELDPEQETATARALVRKRMPSTRGLETQARVRRLAGMLARKGYGAGLAFRVVKEELEREGADTEALQLDTDGLSALE